jgi:FimV-like protein
MRRAFWGLLALILTACAVNPAERNNAANSYTRQGDYDAAVRAYQAAQVAEPNNALLYFNAAQALADSGDFEGAVATLNQAIQRGDDELRAAALHNLGNLYFERELYQSAAEAYQQALLLRANEDTRFNLELALALLDRPTPTPFEQKTFPTQEQVNPTVTPTPQPAPLNQPTSTPTPPPASMPGSPTPAVGGDTGEEGDQFATPRPDNAGDLSAEEAQEILDAIEPERPGVGGFPQMTLTPPTPASQKDW